MKYAEVPQNEAGRLKTLEEYQILDTLDDSSYDAFTDIARIITGCSIAVFSLVDRDRQWFKSHPGLDVHETAREISICGHVVASGTALVLPDVQADERFRDNPFVTGEPYLRFYAGVPLIVDGFTIGTLAVMDTRPREMSSQELTSLQVLGRGVLALLEVRKRFLGLLSAGNVDIFVIDQATMRITFASQRACQRLGYRVSEVIGMASQGVIPELTPALFEELAAAARDGKKPIRETYLQGRDRQTYPAQLALDTMQEQGEERLLVMATNLSLHKAHEREIRVLLEAINAAGDVILVYRVRSTGEHELTYMNDAYIRQSGYTRDEAVGRGIESFRQAMPDDAGMQVLRAAVRDGVPAQSELISYRKDGSSYWNQVTLHPVRDRAGAITHWISIERDISDEVKRAASLAEEHDRLLALTGTARRLFTVFNARALIDTVRDVIRDLLKCHARVLAVADDGRAIEVQELGGTDWTDAFTDELIAKSVQYEMRVVGPREDRAVAYAGRFGESRYVLELRARSSAILRSADLFVFDLVAEYFAVAARNVTLYSELEERRSAVLELSQTKSDLIAMLAHDFRGPLTSIVGFADLTSEVGDVNEEQVEFLQTIKRSALQLSELATDTLTLSRLERNEVSLQIGDVDLVALLASIVAQYGDRRSVSFSSTGDGRMSGDDDRLRQVFSNLIDNAIKYSPNGTSPEVELHADDDSIAVTVRDFGIGIPAGEISQIFDRFSRASNARKMRISGTGFGLFLTKQLVQLHGGTIAVESKESQGTTFVITLPRRGDRRATPRTILLIDAEGERSFLAHGLREAGYRIIMVDRFEEVLAMADGQAVDVLMIVIPGDAFERTEAAQFRVFGRERQIPIVAIADEVSPRLGASLTLSKPVVIGDVVAGITRILGDAMV